MTDEVTPDDIIHFSAGLLYALNKLLDKCPNADFRYSMRNICVTEWARNLKYWKNKLEEKKNERNNTMP